MFILQKSVGEETVEKYGTPVFVTNAETIRIQAEKLLKAFSLTDTKIFYAIKANFDPYIVRIIKDTGIFGIDAVSPNEVRLALELGYTPEQIIFTPSNASDEELRYVYENNVLQNLGSLSELERFGTMFPGSSVSIRICPEIGAGESYKMITGGLESKFGIARDDLDVVRKICRQYKLTILGIHSHIGSGFYDPKVFRDSARAVCAVASEFPELQFIDLGGGFGVPYKLNEIEIDLGEFAVALEDSLTELEKKLGKKIESRIEPGKFLVSQSTVLLTRITTIKERGSKIFVGVDSGMNNLIRPAMYDAYHHIVNISRATGEMKEVSVVGDICETCDIVNGTIDLVDPHEGDLLAVLSAGAYGASMSSNYNMRSLAPNVLLDGNKITLTRKRQTYAQMIETFLIE